MTIKLVEVPCALCGSTAYDEFLRRGDLYLFLPGEFRLVKCRQCGLVYLNPRPAPESMDEIYPAEYGPYSVGLGQERSSLKRADRSYGLRKRGKAIMRHKPGGRLLDVGCATGDFLDVMRSLPGWQVAGVEPSAGAAEAARGLGLEVQTGRVEDATYAPASFDVVTMWNVIEHVPDPVGTLSAIRRLLKPDGLLVFNTPNLDSLGARLFGQYWSGYELPRHFFIFSEDTLRQTLVKAGFRHVERRCFYGSHALAMSSLRFWLRSRKTPPGPRPRWEAALLSMPSRVLTAPLFFVLDQLKLTTAPTDFYVLSA